MNRSILCHLRRHLKGSLVLRTTSNARCGRSCIQALTQSLPSSTTVFTNPIHTSLRVGVEDGNSEGDVHQRSKSRKEKRVTESSTDDEQLKSAAFDAAKSLPGDWTRTADELMARLAIHGSTTHGEDLDKEDANSSSLLSTMKVARDFDRTKRRNLSRDTPGKDRRVTSDGVMQMNSRHPRKPENFDSLYSQPRLGIFDAEQIKAEGDQGKTEDKDNLWHVVFKEKIELAKGGLPRNGFEEVIQWTKDGRMWSFPVDNEEDMHEERQYQFHEHVFLNHHMGDFPTEGPLRRFMDLVVIGLSRNPWISVPEKVEHIRWYADYFRQKQQLLESSIGDKAKMKQS